MGKAIVAKNISYTYDKTPVLDDIILILMAGLFRLSDRMDVVKRHCLKYYLALLMIVNMASLSFTAII